MTDRHESFDSDTFVPEPETHHIYFAVSIDIVSKLLNTAANQLFRIIRPHQLECFAQTC